MSTEMDDVDEESRDLKVNFYEFPQKGHKMERDNSPKKTRGLDDIANRVETEECLIGET